MSDTIITKIDEMGTRIDDLEKSLSELMAQAGGSTMSAPGTSTAMQGPAGNSG